MQKFISLKFHHQHEPWIVFLHQEKCPHQISIPPTKQQFSCYNPIKTSFLAVVIAPVPFNTGHPNFAFIDVQYLQNGVFSFEKFLNGQNYSYTDFYHPIKKSLPSSKFPIPLLRGEISSLPLYCYLEDSGMFYLSITRCKNNFHTFFSLTVNCNSV